MMGNGGVGGRPAGVGVPQGQRGPDAPGAPRTVTSIARSDEYAVQFTDDNGVTHVEIMHRIGGVWHRAPNGENYAAGLKPVSSSSWLVKILEERIASETNTASIPKEDVVDVLGDAAPKAAPAEAAGKEDASDKATAAG